MTTDIHVTLLQFLPLEQPLGASEGGYLPPPAGAAGAGPPRPASGGTG